MADHDKDASDTETGRPLGYGNVDARPPIDGADGGYTAPAKPLPAPAGPPGEATDAVP